MSSNCSCISDSSIQVFFILQILTLVTNLLTPIVAAISFFIQHIKQSDCCGSKIDMIQSVNKNTLSEYNK